MFNFFSRLLQQQAVIHMLGLLQEAFFGKDLMETQKLGDLTNEDAELETSTSLKTENIIKLSSVSEIFVIFVCIFIIYTFLPAFRCIRMYL